MSIAITLQRGSEVRIERLRVLVVDDSVDAASTLGLLLELEGHDVAIEHTGTAGLEAFFSFAPHVAVLDIGMPGLSGYDVARRIRESAAGGATLLLALSAWDSVRDKEEAKIAGFDFHLAKPADLDSLRQLMLQAPGAGGHNSPDPPAE